MVIFNYFRFNLILFYYKSELANEPREIDDKVSKLVSDYRINAVSNSVQSIIPTRTIDKHLLINYL